ncbi:kinase-like protein [Hyaloscypha bicolor E]|uniref:Kinase-like protein n=1 Tax=Hyaloscypha bicolor E TaxID=1095630 RepID=A0A2J6SI85_9HELO|nr:kinase-like protein [Hyaloscypha bicolor E]PMD50486.1 kinase-like protein [Hyaloscypha bicolor E]
MGVSSDPGRKRKSRCRLWDGNIHNLEPLGNGVSGLVLAIDEKRVVKIDIGTQRSIEDLETEREIYRGLNQQHNKHVLRCYEVDNPSGLVLERCDDTIRKRLRSRYRNTQPPEDMVKKWACEAAQGLAYIHRCGVVQVDVGCHNMMLSADGTVKLGDFAGSSLDGSPPTVDYEVRSKLPGINAPNQLSDIFALGSGIWEMATGQPPYSDKTWREVHGLYKRAKFPRLKRIPELDRVIRKCWTQGYNSAQELVDDLEDVAYQGFESSSTLVDSQEYLNLEPQELSPDREAAAKYKYVEHAKTPRHKPRKYDPDPDKWDKKRSRGREKKRDDKGVGFLPKLFSWRSYTYHVRV